MDAVVDGEPVTPRRGKPVEINALWYSALCWASNWAKRVGTDAEVARLQNQAKQVKDAMQKFWNPSVGYLYDTIAPGDCPNAQIRPNAILALSLHHCAFPSTQVRQVVDVAASKLLTPYGLRSLAPDEPEYIGNYGGSAQERDREACAERNRAYHQGTVWSWLIGSFIRASIRSAQPLAIKQLRLLEHFDSQACIGSISEIFDGDPPHPPQGAIAQAWSIAEVIRHFADVKF